MSRIAWVVLGAAVTIVPAAAQPAPSSELSCHDKALTGSGPGFKSSQEESEAAAVKDWLDKARAVYSDADWTKTKEANVECVKQGLYSKCFATAIPCGTAKASAP